MNLSFLANVFGPVQARTWDIDIVPMHRSPDGFAVSVRFHTLQQFCVGRVRVAWSSAEAALACGLIHHTAHIQELPLSREVGFGWGLVPLGSFEC